MIKAKGGRMKYQHMRNEQNGAVSLFVVIFTALLFVAVTVGFTVLMLSDQQAATDNDLAQSALDSANAGTEDAKRVLAQYADCQERALTTPGSNCEKIRIAVNRNECNTINVALGSASGDQSERKIQQFEADDNASALQQAYTCVKITPNTETYVGKTRNEGDIRLIPLKTDGAQFDIVKISWLKREDMELGAGDTPKFEPPDDNAVTGAPEPYQRLLTKTEWREQNRGAVLRVGALQYQAGGVNLNELDDKSRAVFLYSGWAGLGYQQANAIDLDNVDNHRPLTAADQSNLSGLTVNYPAEVRCAEASQGFMCHTYVRLPSGMTPNQLHYLTLASVYRDTSFEVSLINSTDSTPCKNNTAETGCVEFKNVQPEIDVTGRANNVFRRVVSRVESADASEAPYPRAALGVAGDVCKNFVVTDAPDDYKDDAATDAIAQGGSCRSLTTF